MKIGYARVSSVGQNLESQIKSLKDFGCEKIFEEKVSGTSTKGRDKLRECLDYVRDSDVFCVTRIDRCSRSVLDMQLIIKELEEKKVSFEFDGEMTAEVALDYNLIKEKYPFCKFSGQENVLIMPDLYSANISFKLLQKMENLSVIGPIMIGGNNPFQIVQMGASVSDIVNSACISTYNSI